MGYLNVIAGDSKTINYDGTVYPNGINYCIMEFPNGIHKLS